MAKPETRFIDSVHRLFSDKKTPHREKTNNPYRKGTFDVWYSGVAGDLWVEYKYLPKDPQIIRANELMTQHQLDWGEDRYMEGRNVAVIIGFPAGGVILRNLSWCYPISEFVAVDRRLIADWIMQETLIAHKDVQVPVICNKGVGDRS